jgi:hypothetical protein
MSVRDFDVRIFVPPERLHFALFVAINGTSVLFLPLRDYFFLIPEADTRYETNRSEVRANVLAWISGEDA